MMRMIFNFCIMMPFVLFADGLSKEAMELYKARRYGAEAKECLRVVDQDGKPIVGAKIIGGSQTGEGKNDCIVISGVTNTNGEYTICARCVNKIRCKILKEGYYKSFFELRGYSYTHKVKNGMWQPYGEQSTIILKKIHNVHRTNFTVPCKREKLSWKIPVYDKWIGFDFEKFDWCSPYGTGCINDVLLFFTREKKSSIEFKYTMDVAFTNNAFAGAYVMEKDQLSELHTASFVDLSKEFTPFLRYVRERGKDGRNMEFLNDNQYLVFRTRTKEENGKLVQAHYGCIYGKWAPSSDSMELMDGCFNLTSNDLCIEDSFFLRQNIVLLQNNDG